MIKRFEGLEGRKEGSERSSEERGKEDWRRRSEALGDGRVWAEQTGIEKEELIKIQIP